MGDRVKAAQAEALRRFHHEGRQLTSLRFWVVGIVVLVTATSKPTIGLSGRYLALTVALVVFIVEMLGWPVFRSARAPGRVAELSVMGASAVVITVLQPNGVSELPGSAVVFTAGVALAPPFAMALGGAVTVGVAVALALAGGPPTRRSRHQRSSARCLASPAGFFAATASAKNGLSCSSPSWKRRVTTRRAAAAAEERASIARDLHDVLAHSLSGLSVQLEVARKVASNLAVPGELREPIEGAAGLAKQGLVEARAAVGALRRDDELGLDRLPELVEQLRRDLKLKVSYVVHGVPRAVAPELGLTIYLVAGEALTNVARHATGAITRVELSFRVGEVLLSVTDDGGEPSELSAKGSGWGLSGARERVKRLGGDLVAGAAGSGWSVVATVPA